MGYPGVPGNPDEYKPEKSEPVKILGEDAVNALVQHQNGRTELVPKDRLRK
jgi:hypothetical protein